MTGNKKEVIVFTKNIAALGKGTLSERIKGPATIEKVSARFYFGQERQLIAKPYIRKTGNRIEQLFTYPEDTLQYLAGDDDQFDFDVCLQVNNDDEIKVDYENLSVDNAYDLIITVTVDYFGGANRVV